ncbi:MAG: T9SS type A sorting domain-containing protein [Bacteroidota bacterium]
MKFGEVRLNKKSLNMRIIIVSLLFILKSLVVFGQSKTIYIDPGNKNNSDKNGSFSNPFDSWTDIRIESNVTYLQKRGTVAFIPAEINIHSSNVIIGAYGEGERPVIQSNATEKEKIIDIGKSENVTVQDIEIISLTLATTCIGINSSHNISLVNCKIHGANYGIRSIQHTGKLLIKGCEVFNTRDDGMFISELEDIEITECHVYDVNQKWFTNQDQSYSGGDCIQLGYFDKFHIHGNILDHSSTGNKFCFIAISPRNKSGSIFESNICISQKLSEGGGAVYLTDGANMTFRYNYFRNGHNGIYNSSSNLTLYYNIFEDFEWALNSAHPSGSALRSYNNVFFNCNKGIISQKDQLLAYNNIFFFKDNSQTAIHLNSGKIDASHNLYNFEHSQMLNIRSGYIGSLMEFTERTGQGRHSLVADPEFIDVSNGNFSISKTSPCIDAGRNLGLLGDINGTPLADENPPDIGAFEYTTSGMIFIPNPFVDFTKLKIFYTTGFPFRLILYDLQGKKLFVKDRIENREVELNLEANYKGVLIYQLINSNNKQVSTGRILKF